MTCSTCKAEPFAVDPGTGRTVCEDCFKASEIGLPPLEVGPLLEEAKGFIRRYVSLPGEAEELALALFTAHTHALDGAHATPYLLITSPEKRSGKTRLHEALELIVKNPWRVTGASEAAIFRKIAQDRPTLLLDEIDAVFGSHTERTEPLRALLNAGNRPGATVARCVGEKGDQVRDFKIFCPKALAGIDSGRLPDTIRDRSISIAMRRKTDAEPVARFRYRYAEPEAKPLRDRLTAWGEAAAEALLAADPELPPALDDRAAEAWEPLLAIADLAGPDWSIKAREAAIALSTDERPDEQSRGTLLLGAVQTAFGNGDRMPSAELIEQINADEELPFGGGATVRVWTGAPSHGCFAPTT